MQLAELEAIIAGLPGAEVRYPFEDSPWIHVYAVEKKWFAWTDTTSRPATFQAKCDPDIALSLRETYEGIRPGYHMNKRHWITVVLDCSVPNDIVRQILLDAHELIVLSLPKATRARLLADAIEK